MGIILILICNLVIFFYVELRPKLVLREINNKDLLFLTLILLFSALIVKIWVTFPDMWYFGLPLNTNFVSSSKFGIPFATSSMIVCLVLGSNIALPFSLLCSVTVSMFLPNKLEHCIYFFLNSVMAIEWTKNCRERRSIILASLKIGLFCGLMAAVVNAYLVEALPLVLIVLDIFIAFIGGVSSGVIVVGMLPVVEMLFGYLTDITLLELSNLGRPLLRKLMFEAPGTYHHSIIVGSMVEAAASRIGANILLSKVGGYYHDIGKLMQPTYFVENQFDRKNKHDKLSPYMSSLILVSHVKYGAKIGKKYNLAPNIIEVIKQHHGNSLINYFFNKARRLEGESNVNISGFKYPGPKPQTVEAGLVMLADVIEASSRTLVNPTSYRMKNLVKNQINRIFSDGQLDNCNFTLNDLTSIADSFNNILSGIYHHRIEYQSFSYNNNMGKKNKKCQY